jgi:hypothetical protein
MSSLAWLPLLAVGVLLAGCTRAAVPVQTLPTPYRPTRTPIVPTLTPTTEAPPVAGDIEYAVVGVDEGGQLPVRLTAGLSGLANGYLTPQQKGLHLTGNTTLLGSSEWVEVLRADGRTGWVPEVMLTEYVPPTQFCDDTSANAIISDFVQAVNERDGDRLASLVSEPRGLLIRVDWWNPEVRFSKEQVADLFADPTSVDWGSHFASNTRITGSFAEVVLPQIEDVLGGNAALACDDFQVRSLVQGIARPAAYENFNFYNFYRPAPQGGSEFNWRAWSILIEYIDGQPYLVGLVQYRPQV